MVICNPDKLDGKRCNGAPDFIIEIVSPGNPADDYIRKLYYYKNAGVREYWIVDPRRRTITVNFFEQNILNIQYSFDATIKVNIYDDLYIDFSEIDAMLNWWKIKIVQSSISLLYNAIISIPPKKLPGTNSIAVFVTIVSDLLIKISP